MKPLLILLLLAPACLAASKNPADRAAEQAAVEAFRKANADFKPRAPKVEKPLDVGAIPMPKTFKVLSWEQYVKLHKTNPRKCQQYIEAAQAELARMDAAYDAMSPEMKSPHRMHTVCTPSRTQIVRGKTVPEGLTHYDLLHNMVVREWHTQQGLWNESKPQLYDQGYQNLDPQYKSKRLPKYSNKLTKGK